MRRSACVGTLVAVAAMAAGAWGQERPAGVDTGQDRPSAGVAQAGPPNPIPSMGAFNVVERWVRAWQAGGVDELPKELGAVGGCMVTLRLERRVVGRGVSFEEGAAGIVSAVKRAMEDADTRVQVVRDATEMDQRRAAAKGMTISLEMAGARTPLVAGTYGEVDSVLEPGLDGVAVTVGEKAAGSFPSEMMITNRPPSDALISSISEASGDPTLAVREDPKGQPGELKKDGKATFQKFRVTHVAQVRAGGGPRLLFRGGVVVAAKDVTAKSMSEFAAQLAAHLRERIDRKGTDLRMVGSLMPFQGRELQSASVVERLIVTAALARHAQRLPQAKFGRPELVELRELCASVGEAAVGGPVESAAWVIASREVEKALPRAGGAEGGTFVNGGSNQPAESVFVQEDQPVKGDLALKARIGARVASGFDVDTGWSKEVPEGARGFVAFALVIEAKEEGLEAGEREARMVKAEKAVRAVFEGTPPAKVAGQMPWLAFAELELGGEVKAAAALLGMREMVWKHQLTSEDSRGEVDDLVGGIVFTTSANPLPTAQSVRPVLALARMARDRRVMTEAESMTELARLLNAVRFLRQLAVDENSGYACPDEKAMWGVRSSLWDQRQPAEATALTLWAVCEVLEMVEGKK